MLQRIVIAAGHNIRNNKGVRRRIPSRSKVKGSDHATMRHGLKLLNSETVNLHPILV